MLKHSEPNPLAIFNLRRVEFIPPHFESMTFDMYTDSRIITNWIYENTEGRFFFGQSSNQNCVAFENHSELSYFSLMLSQFNNPKTLF